MIRQNVIIRWNRYEDSVLETMFVSCTHTLCQNNGTMRTYQVWFIWLILELVFNELAYYKAVKIEQLCYKIHYSLQFRSNAISFNFNSKYVYICSNIVASIPHLIAYIFSLNFAGYMYLTWFNRFAFQQEEAILLKILPLAFCVSRCLQVWPWFKTSLLVYHDHEYIWNKFAASIFLDI